MQVQHLSHVLNIYARHDKRKETQKIEEKSRKKRRKRQRGGENDTAWKLTKKHQHQVKLLLLQPAYEARGLRDLLRDTSKVALDIVVVIWNSSKGQVGEGQGAGGRHDEAQTVCQRKCNLNARNIWTRLLSALFDCAQLFKKVSSLESIAMTSLGLSHLIRPTTTTTTT